MSSVPYDFRFINLYESARQPGTVHCRDTALVRYYVKYLFQKMISVFEFEGLPETWARNYFEYVLFGKGHLAVLDTDRYGVIPQDCGLGGFNVFYQPRFALIANPLLQGIGEVEIGVDCEVVKLQPDYSSPLDIVANYADMMALCMETAGVNLLNSKLAYVFAAGNKTQAESFKKMFDQIASGQPAAFIGKDLFNEDGSRNWDVFFQNLKQNYVAGDVLNDMAKIEQRFCTAIGIPNANTEKRERLITDEVQMNNAETASLVSLWLDTMREDLKRVNEMFGLNISVNYRYEEDNRDEESLYLDTDSAAV